MENRIGSLIEGHSKSISEFSRTSGVPYGTLYDIAKGKTKKENIGVGYFIKIAETLGMTAEELYYGTPPESPSFKDPRQNALNTHYEEMNERGRERLAEEAMMMANSGMFAKSEDHRVSKTA